MKERRKIRAIRMTDEEWETFKSLKLIKTIREVIKQNKDTKPGKDIQNT